MEIQKLKTNTSERRFLSQNLNSKDEHSHFVLENNQPQTSKKQVKRFVYQYRRLQIALSLVLLALSMLWVQITVQNYGPFIRTAQCYLNKIIFLHGSQDIYGGPNVIYFRNGYYYNFKQIQEMFSRLSLIKKTLEGDSFFIIDNQAVLTKDKPQVELLTLSKYSIPSFSHKYNTSYTTLQEMPQFFNSTLLNHTFYQHLWKLEISIIVPLIYRGETVVMRIHFEGEIYSSLLLHFIMNVDILDSKETILKDSQSLSQSNLGASKRNNNHDLSLSFQSLKWLILLLMGVVFGFELHFIFHKRQHINEKRRISAQHQLQFEQILQQMDQQINVQQAHQLQHKLLNTFGDLNSKSKSQIYQSVQLSSKNIKQIGVYFILEAFITLITFYGFLINSNGLVCFLCCLKIIVYLSQTKNRLMFGFLLEQTIPTYFRIYLNIFILIVGFVSFNLLVLKRALNFQSIGLGFFQYVFNYFQYGIYQKFIFTFLPSGLFSSLYYSLHLLFLLYIGNSILMSVLANQVSKNSYLKSVQQMIYKIQAQCPVCGQDFQELRNVYKSAKSKYQKQLVISQLIRNLQIQKLRFHSEANSQNHEIQIAIKHPALSPFFPAKTQKSKKRDESTIRQYKVNALQNYIKLVQKNIKKQQGISQKHLNLLNRLKAQLQKRKKINIQITKSKIQIEFKAQQFIKINYFSQILLQAVQSFKLISNNRGLDATKKINEYKTLVLNDLLSKVSRLQKSKEYTIKK